MLSGLVYRYNSTASHQTVNNGFVSCGPIHCKAHVDVLLGEYLTFNLPHDLLGALLERLLHIVLELMNILFFKRQ